MTFWIRVPESPSLHVTSQPWLVGKCQGFYQSSVVCRVSETHLNWLMWKIRTVLKGTRNATAHRPGTRNWKTTRNPSICLLSLSVLCSVQTLPSPPFFWGGGGGGGLFFCRLVTLLLPAHSSSWLPHGFQVNIAYLSGQGKVINKWTPVSQWLNITKVYFFSHYSSSVGDRYTTISWCCRLNRWFQGCQQQSWR